MSGLRKYTPWAARPLPEAAKNEKHRQALDLVATNVLLGRHAIYAGWAVGAVGAVALIASAVGWTITLPLHTVENHMQLINATTGIVSDPVSLKDAPKLFPEATDRHYLWQYLLACESWTPENDKENDHICKVMSSPTRQAQYQEWRDSPISPMNTIGRDGHISIDDNSVFYYKRKKEGDTINYLIEFNRTIWRSERKVGVETWTADVAFQYHPELPMKPNDRNINDVGMVVINWDRHQGLAAETKK